MFNNEEIEHLLQQFCFALTQRLHKIPHHEDTSLYQHMLCSIEMHRQRQKIEDTAFLDQILREFALSLLQSNGEFHLYGKPDLAEAATAFLRHRLHG